jgi:hypothetical protein
VLNVTSEVHGIGGYTFDRSGQGASQLARNTGANGGACAAIRG